MTQVLFPWGGFVSHSYDAYGQPIADTDVATGQPEAYQDPVGFGGQHGYYYDTESGLSLLTNRYYAPRTGRFITRDPIGYSGGINLYGFAGNDPVKESDPSGYALPIQGPFGELITLKLITLFWLPKIGPEASFPLHALGRVARHEPGGVLERAG